MAFADGNIVIGTSVDVGGMNTGLYKIQKAMKRWTRVVGVGLTAGLYKVGKASLDAASDLQEIQNVVDVAFKDMSYKVEEFTKICIEHFGMSQLSAKQTAGSFMAMGASIGLTQEAASDMAVELTGLTGDFASFYNISQQYAKVALSAVYTGETETLKRYGIILTEANLQEYALTQGITKKVKAMNAEEKVLLRYNYIMQATMNMHGDFERTQESWANTLRVLKERWTQLLSVVGAGTIQVVQPFIRMISEATAKLISLFQYINDLLGIEAELDTAEVSQDMQELSDSVEEAGDTIKHQLGSFDKLNNLITTTNKANDDTSDLDKLYEKFKLSGYVIDAMKNWEVATNEFSLTVQRNINELIEFLTEKRDDLLKIFDDLKTGDWLGFGFDAGTFIHDAQIEISDAVSRIDWTKIGEDFGKFFKGITWSGALFGWVDILTSTFNGLIDLAVAAVDTISISDIIKLADDLSQAAIKIFNAISGALQKVNWFELGNKVGTFLANIDWLEALKAAAKALWEGFKAALELIGGIFYANPVATALLGTIVATVVGAAKILKWTGLASAMSKSLKKALKNKLTSPVQKSITDGITNAVDKWVPDTNTLASMLSKAIGVISIGLSVGIAVSKWEKIKTGEQDADELTTRLQDLASALAAGVGFALVFNPAVGAIVGALALIANIAVDATVKPLDEVKMAAAQRQLREELAAVEWYKNFQDTIDVIVNLSVNASAQISEINGNMDYYEQLAKKWYDMSQNQEQLSDAERELMRMYSQQLSVALPGLAEQIDEVSGAYKGTWEQLDKLISKTKEYMYVQAYGNISLEYAEKLAKSEEELYKFKQKNKEISAKYNSAFSNYFDQTKGQYKAGSVAETIYQQLTQSDPRLISSWVKKYGNMNEVVVQIGKLVENAATKGQKKIQIGSNWFDFSKIEVDWDSTLKGETAYDLMAAMLNNKQDIAAYEKAYEDAQKELQYFIDKQQDAMLKYIEDGGNSEDLGAYVTEGFANGIDDPQANKKLEDNTKKVVGKPKAEIVDTYAIGSPSKVTEELGGYVTEGFAIGILSGIDDVVSATRSVVSAALDVFNDTNILPKLKIVPEIDMASVNVPDIASGTILPVGVTAASSSASAVSGMSKKELSGIIGNAVAQAMSNIVLKSEFNVNGDPKHIFDIVQTEARVYNKRTGSPAFGGR